MKFDPLITPFLLVFLNISNALICNIKPKPITPYRLCVRLDDDGFLKATVVECSQNDICDDPEYYPCIIRTSGPEVPTSTSTNVATTPEVSNIFTTESSTDMSEVLMTTDFKQSLSYVPYNFRFSIGISPEPNIGNITFNVGTTDTPKTTANGEETSTVTTPEPITNNFTFNINQSVTESTQNKNGTSVGTTVMTREETYGDDVNITKITTLMDIIAMNVTFSSITEINSVFNITSVTQTEFYCNESEKYPATFCNQYLICNPELQNAYLVQTCPEGLVFDADLQECTTAEDTNCIETTTAVGTISTTSFPNPLNQLISGANIIISAITTILIVIGFILFDFIF